ncbi:hypothetical protein PG984_007942 [Apiospora sp. TS-2023a]
MHLTHALLPQSWENHVGEAVVISVRSMTDMGMPLAAIYPASTTFNMTLFDILALEDRLARRETREGCATVLMPPAGLLGKPRVVIYRDYPVVTLKVTR